MDAVDIDRLARGLAAAGSRRGLLGWLAALPLGGGLAALFAPADGDANGRRQRRKKRHKHGRGRRRRHDKGRCKPHARAATCAGKCGVVKNNCKKAVDCGLCGCDPACNGETEICFQGACVACDVCASGCPFRSVQSAIDAAGPGATIAVCAGRYPETITISRNLTLRGAGQASDPAANTILAGVDDQRVVTIINATVLLEQVRISDGNASFDGGGILNERSKLTLTDCTVSGNTARIGGGIANYNGMVTLNGCTVSGNEADNGGGIFNYEQNAPAPPPAPPPPPPTVTLNGGTVRGNVANEEGGGIYNQAAVVLQAGATVTGNDCGSDLGSGIYNDGTIANLATSSCSDDSKVTGNGHSTFPISAFNCYTEGNGSCGTCGW